MQIKIVDSWLREFLETKASASEIARQLSLTSVSVGQTEPARYASAGVAGGKAGDDYTYDIEVTTNRPDLMSVAGIAKEATASLSGNGIAAKYIPPKTPKVAEGDISFPIEIKNDPKLVNRIMAVVLEVNIGKSPKEIANRLELSGIRSLNNLVDVTNYVMREIGHPAHVFDYDLLNTKEMIIRGSKKGEIITTLDGKEYRLLGGDIVADNGEGEIIDLLGIMGTANSVVNEKTKRILFFLDNNNPDRIRQTSMSLGIRTEAAIVNEKGVDPEFMELALKRGIELYQQIAQGKVVSKILDVYPNKPKTQTVKVSLEKINKIIGVGINPNIATEILQKLGFKVSAHLGFFKVEVPSERINDIKIEEDIIEEIARIYGYHRIPSIIPSFLSDKTIPYANNFYWEDRIKSALKYWGYTEVYTYSLVSEDLFDGPINNAIKLKNPLTSDMVYLRNTLVPSLLEVAENNKAKEIIKIFELANTYHKSQKARSTSHSTVSPSTVSSGRRTRSDRIGSGQNLPKEKLTLAGLIKKTGVSFFEVKGLIEALFDDLEIKNYKVKNRVEGGAEISIENENVGYIEILNSNLIDFEINFEILLKNATNKKVYKPLAKFPAVFEDITFVLDEAVSTQDVIEEISLQSFLIREVKLKDQFENARTFHIIYQAEDRNLTSKEVSEIREQVISAISSKFNARVK
ncbi:MAG: phenylalanine--tRNA ligase subunit beta [Candidatus Levybacteria bacterium]|nr:phenylalanine--tRNA ligase subunit beta [Candidatus Levybacteria bacterium]